MIFYTQLLPVLTASCWTSCSRDEEPKGPLKKGEEVYVRPRSRCKIVQEENAPRAFTARFLAKDAIVWRKNEEGKYAFPYQLKRDVRMQISTSSSFILTLKAISPFIFKTEPLADFSMSVADVYVLKTTPLAEYSKSEVEIGVTGKVMAKYEQRCAMLGDFGVGSRYGARGSKRYMKFGTRGTVKMTMINLTRIWSSTIFEVVEKDPSQIYTAICIEDEGADLASSKNTFETNGWFA